MTDGTSQGLFIVVAIVIFGIFVVLAYILFEDTLSPAMASMFNEVIVNTEKIFEKENLIINPILNPVRVNILNGDYKETGVYNIQWDGTDVTVWDGDLPSGLSLNYQPVLNWGETITVTFDILSSVDTEAGIDFNARNLGIPYITNDMYGSQSSPNFLNLYLGIKANEKTTVTYSIKNDNLQRNPNRLPISEYSIFGIKTKLLKDNPTFEISNVSYKITMD